MSTSNPIVYRAGGIVRRKVEGKAEYLLVTSCSRPDMWIIPAGHVEPRETAETAAIREVLEEAGVQGRIITELNPMEYSWEHEGQVVKVRTSLFLMEYEATIGVSPEGRRVDFFNWEALKTLKLWQETREVMAQFESIEAR